MWKIVGSTLTDKSNLWSEGFGKIWVIPELGKSGMIENQNDNKTLRIERNINTETNEVKEGEKDEMDPLQNWERIATDRSDYFLLKNPKSETYLTATINGQLTVDGNTLEGSIKEFWGFKQLLLQKQSLGNEQANRLCLIKIDLLVYFLASMFTNKVALNPAIP